MKIHQIGLGRCKPPTSITHSIFVAIARLIATQIEQYQRQLEEKWILKSQTTSTACQSALLQLIACNEICFSLSYALEVCVWLWLLAGLK